MPYLPVHDTVTDPDVLRAFITEHPLAAVVSHDGEEPDLDLIPLLWDESSGHTRLVGHVARGNPIWRDDRQQGPVLAAFGPVEHYVSPSWYPAKADSAILPRLTAVDRPPAGHRLLTRKGSLSPPAARVGG